MSCHHPARLVGISALPNGRRPRANQLRLNKRLHQLALFGLDGGSLMEGLIGRESHLEVEVVGTDESDELRLEGRIFEKSLVLDGDDRLHREAFHHLLGGVLGTDSENFRRHSHRLIDGGNFGGRVLVLRDEGGDSVDTDASVEFATCLADLLAAVLHHRVEIGLHLLDFSLQILLAVVRLDECRKAGRSHHLPLALAFRAGDDGRILRGHQFRDANLGSLRPALRLGLRSKCRKGIGRNKTLGLVRLACRRRSRGRIGRLCHCDTYLTFCLMSPLVSACARIGLVPYLGLVWHLYYSLGCLSC